MRTYADIDEVEEALENCRNAFRNVKHSILHRKFVMETYVAGIPVIWESRSPLEDGFVFNMDRQPCLDMKTRMLWREQILKYVWFGTESEGLPEFCFIGYNHSYQGSIDCYCIYDNCLVWLV